MYVQVLQLAFQYFSHRTAVVTAIHFASIANNPANKQTNKRN